MIYTVKLLSIDPDIDEKCCIKIVGITPVILTCFAVSAPFKLHCGEYYTVEITPFVNGDYAVHRMDDETQPRLKRINAGFSYEAFGELEGNTIFSSISLESEYLGLHFDRFTGKMICWEIDRLDISFISKIPFPTNPAQRGKKSDVMAEARQCEIAQFGIREKSYLRMTPFEILRNENLLNWNVLAIGFKRGWCEKNEIIKYAEKYVELSRKDIQYPIIEIVMGEKISNMQFKKALDGILELNDSNESMESVFARWYYAILVSIAESTLNENDKILLIDDLYSKIETYIKVSDCNVCNRHPTDTSEDVKCLIDRLRNKVKGNQVEIPGAV